MPVDIKNIKINISYDIIHIEPTKKKLKNLRSFPKKHISALALLAEYYTTSK
jgi:hypothetical protein